MGWSGSIAAGITINNGQAVSFKDSAGNIANGMTLDSSDDLFIGDATHVDNMVFDVATSGTFSFDANGAPQLTIEATGDLTLNAAMFLKEQAAKSTARASYGQLFVKTASPNTLHFVNDADTEIELGAVGATILVNDLTPQLGGDLDLNGNIIGLAAAALNFASNGVVNFAGPSGANNILKIQAATGRESVFRLANFDVGHPITAKQPADVYLDIKAISSTAGGGQITGISDADASALIIRCYIGATNPTDSTPACQFQVGKSDGSTGATSLGAAETVFQVSDHDGGTDFLTINGAGDVTFLNDLIAAGLDATTGTNLLLSASNIISKDSSSRMYKENITEAKMDTAQIFNLIPRDFNFKADQNKQTMIGWIAEEVAKDCPNLVRLNDKGKPESWDIREALVMTVAELKKLKERL